jgi:heme A synthase
MSAAQTDNGRVLGWGFAGLAAASFVLIVLGALVRAHGAGLACPDWPLCFGERSSGAIVCSRLVSRSASRL